MEKVTTSTILPSSGGYTKWRTVSLLVGAFFLTVGVLWAASIAWVPWLLKNQLPDLVHTKLGRTLALGDVEFKPWSLNLSLHDIVVQGQAPGDPPMLAMGKVQIDAAWASIWRLAPVLDALYIEAPRIRVEHLGDGHYDFDDVLDRLAKPDAKPTGNGGGDARFAVYNVTVKDGAIDFVDRPTSHSHLIRDLKITLPFLSNLPVFREAKVEPAVSFTLNGSGFDSKAQTKPFKSNRQSDIQLAFEGVDLQPYQAYLPANLPVKFVSGTLGAQIHVSFDQEATHALRINGAFDLRGLKLAVAGKSVTSKPLLSLSALHLNVAEFLPLERKVYLEKFELVEPEFAIERLSDGTIPLLATFDAGGVSPKRSGEAVVVTKVPSPWMMKLDHLILSNGSVSWRDASTGPVSQMKLANFQLRLGQLAWPLAQPASFKLGGDYLANGKQSGRLGGEGTFTAQQADGQIQISQFDLSATNSYLSQWINPQVSGQLNSTFGFQWRAALPSESKSMQAVMDIPELTIDKLSLNSVNSELKPKATDTLAALGAIQQIKLRQLKVDVPQQNLEVGSLSVGKVELPVERSEDGRWMYESWLKAQVRSAPNLPTGQASSGSDRAWKVAVSEFSLDDLHIPFVDKTTTRPVRLDVRAAKFKLNNWKLGSNNPVPVDLQVKVSSGRLEPGNLTLSGNLFQTPLGLEATVKASRLPMHPLSRYVASELSFDLLRADSSFNGRVKFRQTNEGPSLVVIGDAALEDLRANVKTSSLADKSLDGDELLSWKALGLRGVELAMSPGTPLQLNVRETALSDFFARLVLRADGKFNLQELTQPSGGTNTAAAVATPVGDDQSAGANVPPAQIRFGGLSLVNGKVFFSDHFIQPNYSADLSELTGRLGAFSTQVQGTEVQMADLELRGRAEGSATLEILGKLNPLAKPLAMDIKGRVRELELPPLSAYSIKYAGHAIERGKLSLDVNYLVLPTGELTANNKLVLNSLKFGDKVEGAKASLPVRLAVSLLTDSNGVIDLDLPISGSLNDPQFRVGSVVFKVLGNLISKSLTSPFSLLSSSLGGVENELSNVNFAPGTSQLTEASRQNLDKVAKVIESKPSLLVTVVGLASLEAERDAYQHERLQALVQIEKRRAAITGSKVAIEDIAKEKEMIRGEEYENLLRRVYRRANIVKPRTLLGVAKDIPVVEMEALLLANLPATEGNLKDLALQRAVTVRDYLASIKVPSNRLFLGASKTVEEPGKWLPRAELNLSTP